MMETASHIRALERDGRLLVKAAREAGLDAPVPSCPGWNVRDLLAHIGFVHRWAATYVSTAREEMLEEADEDTVLASAPPADELLEWVEAGHLALVRSLEETPGDVRCWTFLPAPSPLAFWARRQAHETAVHRVDAELAAGRPPHPFAPPFAADGVDELLTCFVPRRRTNLRADAATSLAVRCTDDEASWTVHVDEDGTRTEPGAAADAACTLRGRATDLYATLWNRAGPGRLAVEGDPAVLDLFLDHVHVRWA